MKKFTVSEDTEVVLDGKKYLLESGDKIVLEWMSEEDRENERLADEWSDGEVERNDHYMSQMMMPPTEEETEEEKKKAGSAIYDLNHKLSKLNGRKDSLEMEIHYLTEKQRAEIKEIEKLIKEHESNIERIESKFEEGDLIPYGSQDIPF